MPDSSHHDISPQEVEALEKLLTSTQTQLSPSPEFIARMQKRLERHHVLMQERAEATDLQPKRGFFSFIGTHAYSALTAFTFVIFTGGLSTFAYTSDSVTNGSTLYGIKRGIESIERTFAGTPEARAEHQMRMLSRRLGESRFLTMRGIVDEPTNQEVSLVVNDGILAIQAIDKDDYRNQLLDRITHILLTEEQKLYEAAGVTRDSIETSEDTIISESTSIDSSLPPDVTSDVITVPRSNLSIPDITTESTQRVLEIPSLLEFTPPRSEGAEEIEIQSIDASSNVSSRESFPAERVEDVENREAGSERDRSQTRPSIGQPVPLHVRPGVINALQKNRRHFKQMELRLFEARRSR